jgi:hypothetical protein
MAPQEAICQTCLWYLDEDGTCPNAHHHNECPTVAPTRDREQDVSTVRAPPPEPPVSFERQPFEVVPAPRRSSKNIPAVTIALDEAPPTPRQGAPRHAQFPPPPSQYPWERHDTQPMLPAVAPEQFQRIH